ncbi:MAG: RluA family pseudouridine synthase [Saprospiraceae bacterium]|nr:RluA family pseudouridine synthase [Saprospiraceae bacterium]MDW8228834.1 RluA family pseudouridine synthase [Saprospiraceae bacterium]
MADIVIYEDNHLLALNKPAGWLVQGDRTGDATLTDWGKAYLREKYAKPGAVFLHPVHRLDRPVSGLTLFARTDKALSRLTAAFRERRVEKTYLALVLAMPPAVEGELRHWLFKDEAQNRVFVAGAGKPGAQEAVLHYRWLGQFGDVHLLEVHPYTGRPHQIRAQLSAVGCPILGDLKYGAPAPLPEGVIGLHSRSLRLEHPVRREPLFLEAPLPEAAHWRQVAECL